MTELFVAVPGVAFAQSTTVDWKLYGGASFAGEAVCFYDAEGVTQEPVAQIRVWTKCLGQKDLDALRRSLTIHVGKQMHARSI